MKDALEVFAGLDKTNEIFMIWYEVTYLRLVLGKLMNVGQHPKEMVDSIIENSRTEAEEFVVKRFPSFKIKFSPPK